MTDSNDEDNQSGNLTTLVVFGENVALNAFIDNLFQKLVLAVASSLHAPELTGKEKVCIEISK
ncbi:MAG: hypothetical protein ACFFCO_01635 [Promethearchaeota archaeon]